MLRINLLPAYLAERRKRNAAIWIMGILLLVVAGGMLGYNFGVQKPALEQKTTETTDMENQAKAETDYESATTALLSKVKPLQDKVDFVDQVRYHNTIRQKIFRNAAAYTYRNIEYNSMAVSGNTMSISAYARSISDIGRFYILMFGNPDVTALSISGIPDWKTVQAVEIDPKRLGGQTPVAPSYPVAMTATLVRSVSPPSLPASLDDSGAGGAGGGAPNMGGGPSMGGAPASAGAPTDAGGGAAAGGATTPKE